MLVNVAPPLLLACHCTEGDVPEAAALNETARCLGGGLAVIINTLNPAQIFVGGEIAEASMPKQLA